MQVVDCPHLHVEQIADLAMAIGVVAHAVKLQVNIAQASFGGFATEIFALGEFDSVGRCLNAVVTNLARILDRFDEVRRNRGLSTRELYRHLPTRLDRDRVIKNLADFIHA